MYIKVLDHGWRFNDAPEIEYIYSEYDFFLLEAEFAVDEENAKHIMEVYDYVWTDEEI